LGGGNESKIQEAQKSDDNPPKDFSNKNSDIPKDPFNKGETGLNNNKDFPKKDSGSGFTGKRSFGSFWRKSKNEKSEFDKKIDKALHNTQAELD